MSALLSAWARVPVWDAEQGLGRIVATHLLERGMIDKDADMSPITSDAFEWNAVAENSVTSSMEIMEYDRLYIVLDRGVVG